MTEISKSAVLYLAAQKRHNRSEHGVFSSSAVIDSNLRHQNRNTAQNGIEIESAILVTRRAVNSF